MRPLRVRCPWRGRTVNQLLANPTQNQPGGITVKDKSLGSAQKSSSNTNLAAPLRPGVNSAQGPAIQEAAIGRLGVVGAAPARSSRPTRRSRLSSTTNKWNHRTFTPLAGNLVGNAFGHARKHAIPIASYSRVGAKVTARAATGPRWGLWSMALTQAPKPSSSLYQGIRLRTWVAPPSIATTPPDRRPLKHP